MKEVSYSFAVDIRGQRTENSRFIVHRDVPSQAILLLEQRAEIWEQKKSIDFLKKFNYNLIMKLIPLVTEEKLVKKLKNQFKTTTDSEVNLFIKLNPKLCDSCLQKNLSYGIIRVSKGINQLLN